MVSFTVRLPSRRLEPSGVAGSQLGSLSFLDEPDLRPKVRKTPKPGDQNLPHARTPVMIFAVDQYVRASKESSNVHHPLLPYVRRAARYRAALGAW